MRKHVKMDPFDNVVAGKKTTLKIPVGLTYDSITLKYSGVTLSQLQNATLKVGSKAIQTWPSLADMETVNDYYGRDKTAGYITWYLNQPEMFELYEQRLTGLGTQDVANAHIEIQIDAAAAAPALEAFCVQSDVQPVGAVVKVREYPYSAATAGLQQISSLEAAGARVKAIHFIKADVDNVNITVDSVNVFDLDKDMAEIIQKIHGRTPQTAKATHVDFTLEGDSSQSMVTEGVQSLQIRPTFGTSGSMSMLVEYFDAAKTGI